MHERFPPEFWINVRDQISNVASEYDPIWRKRIRLIGTEFLFLFIFKLVLSKNKQGYGSVLIELWDNSADRNLPLPKKGVIAASSICKAMQNFPEEAFTTLNKRILSEWERNRWCIESWYGHRVFAVDGSKSNLPRELVKDGYKTPGDHSYYPQGLVSCLYDLKKAIPYDFDLVSHMNERDCAIKHLKVLQSRDVVVFDRGYFSYLLVKTAFDQGIFAVFRMQCNYPNPEIKAFWKSDETDKIVKVNPPKDLVSKSKTSNSKIEYKPISIRLIKYKVSGKTYVLATLLTDKRYPASVFPDLYHSRWGIEELYKISKCFIEVEDFHGKSERRVKQELYAHFVLVSLARIFECQAEELLPENLIGTFKNESQTGNRLKSAIKLPKGRHYPSQEETEKLPSIAQAKTPYVPKYTIDNALAKSKLSKPEVPTIPKDKEKKDSIKTKVKLNFKNCLLVLQRTMEHLFLFNSLDFAKLRVPRILNSIVRLRQKIRPDRHYPRISRKPLKRRKSNPKQEVQLGAAIAAPG